MEENLVGYLINTLDEPTRREVETYLLENPEARGKLKLLRQALAPLEADRQGPEPPAGLVIRTLGRVAEWASRELPRAPRGFSRAGGTRPVWRRIDVMVAASILLVMIGMAVPALLQWRTQARVVDCQENLRVFSTALHTYNDQHGSLPDVNAQAPYNVAGLVVPLLVQAKTLPPGASVRCPGKWGGQTCPLTLEQIQKMGSAEFTTAAPSLVPCYAYSLGYRDENGYHPPQFPPGKMARWPIMSDRPPADDLSGNSPNHEGTGQNVLFADGHVQFLTSRSVGFDDDIFCNKQGMVKAGVGPDDAVLGPSSAKP